MAGLLNKQLYNKINDSFSKISRRRWYGKFIKKHYQQLKDHDIPIRKLSKEQKQQIIDVWGKQCGKDYYTHELVYSITGEFDPYICSVTLFGTDIEFALNRKYHTGAWSDKNYFDKFFPSTPMPYTIVRNIHGVFYDHDYNIIDMDTAINNLSGYDYVCIKPSLTSGGGLGVKKLAVDENLADTIKSYGKNFIIQEIIQQHPAISAINESSVNTIRMITLFLNGKITVLNAIMRFGAMGAFNDNSKDNDGMGRFIIGVTDDGHLKNVGYYGCGKSLSVSPSGAEFAGLKIPGYEKAKELAISVHSQMPFARLSAFDIAIDKDGEPKMVEYNLMGIGTYYYQISSGPLFGDRTQELIDTLRKEEKLS